MINWIFQKKILLLNELNAIKNKIESALVNGKKFKMNFLLEKQS